MMQTQLRLGSAFGTTLYVDVSWLFFLIFGAVTLVSLRIEPIAESIITMLLLFGSVLMVALMQIREAHNQGLGWTRVTLVPLGNIVERTYRSRNSQEVSVAGIGLFIHIILAFLFGGLWFLMSSNNPLATELQLVSGFNVFMGVFHFFYRLSPSADNLLHAILSNIWQTDYPSRFLKLIEKVSVWFYVAGGIVILLTQLNHFALAWWFFSLLILSRIVTLGEEHGEYREIIPFSFQETAQI